VRTRYWRGVGHPGVPRPSSAGTASGCRRGWSRWSDTVRTSDRCRGVLLTYMREEEKLARDVYLVLDGRWRTSPFSGIASSEQKHTDAIRNLLTRYGLADPASGKGIGEFQNALSPAALLSVVDKGNLSLTDAFEVGVIVEETDINDLKQAIGTGQAHGHLERLQQLAAGLLPPPRCV